MYKKHGQFFNRLNNLAGLGAIRPGLTDRASRSIGIDRSEREKRREMKPCVRCGVRMRRVRLARHLLKAHDLRQCPNCEEFIQESAFNEHIEKHHGAEALQTWLRLNEK